MSIESKAQLSLNEVKFTGDGVWSIPCDWICITTNGLVKRDGRAVMGAGIALQAEKKVKGCEVILGKKITQSENHVYPFGERIPLLFKPRPSSISHRTQQLISFPTKNDWRNPSEISLIEQSCQELLKLWKESSIPIESSGKHSNVPDDVEVDYTPSTVTYRKPIVCMPKPGCLNGGLDYTKTVRPVLLKYFGTPDVRDHFIVCV